jgi:hypothetical protein
MSRFDHGQVPGTYGALLALRCLLGLDGCKGEECYCRCHAQLDEATKQRIRTAAGEAARQALEVALSDTGSSPTASPS